MSTLIERLRIKAGVMEMGERIAWGSDTALMREAAGKIEALEAQLESVGAGGVGAMMPKQLAVECDGDWSAAYQHPALQRAEIAVRDAEIAALNAERYRFVVSSTDHSVAKWHDCEGWYAIEEVDLDADMQAQAVKPSQM